MRINPWDLEHTLFATPTLQLPNVGLGDLSGWSDADTRSVRSLQSMTQRQKLAKEGKAMPGGEYPIPDVAHLKKAIQAYGRAKDKPKTKRWIIRRARGLKRPDLLPQSWGAAPKSKSTTSAVAAGSGWKSDATGAMLAIYPPPDIADALAGTEDGDHPASELHCTLVFLGDASELDDASIEALHRAVSDVTMGKRPITAQATNVGSFDASESDHPRFYALESTGLTELRDQLVKAAQNAGVDPNLEHDFTPHVTARYGGTPLTEVPDAGEQPWSVDAVVLVVGGDRSVFPLGHDFMPGDDFPDICELCHKRQQALQHTAPPMPSFYDDMQPGGASDVNGADAANAPDDTAASARVAMFNWVEQTGGLPLPIKQVAKAIARGGKNQATSIAIAVSRAKRWAATSKDVKTRAKYAAAVAEWEAKKAASHADNLIKGAVKKGSKSDKNSHSVDLLTLSMEELHELAGTVPGTVPVLDLEEGRSMPSMQSASDAASAQWDPASTFYWDPDTDETYKIGPDGIVMSFVNNVWTPSNVSAAEVSMLPSVDDPETLASLVGAAVAEDVTGTDVVPDGAGRRFRIPIVIPEGIPSGDTRSFSKGACEYKEPPIPLLWQRETDEGHKGSVTVGKITSIERIENGLGNAEGVFDTHPDAIEAARQVKDKFLTGVSGDVDQFEAELSSEANGEEAMEIKHGRLVAVTLVAKPAFQEATIEFVVEDGEEAVIVASAGPVNPPKVWFEDPQLAGPTHLTVDDDGRVFGHIATWGTRHVGNPALKPPHSPSGYKKFCTSSLRTAEGSTVPVGQLTLAGGHAALSLAADKVMAHYDDTHSAVADVSAGEDEFGIWVAGATRSDVSEQQIRAFRGSDPSGDWRAFDGALDLVAVMQVNVPGFPVPQSLVASGVQVSLVAAGAAELKMGMHEPTLLATIGILEDRIATMEAIEDGRRRLEFEAEINSLRT